jgi:hypothetical protein
LTEVSYRKDHNTEKQEFYRKKRNISIARIILVKTVEGFEGGICSKKNIFYVLCCGVCIVGEGIYLDILEGDQGK